MNSFADEKSKLVYNAIDALKKWREELDAVNERGLANTMKCMTIAQQALNWPDSATDNSGDFKVLPGKMHYFIKLSAVHEQLLKSSREDMRVIEEVAEACFASLPIQT